MLNAFQTRIVGSFIAYSFICSVAIADAPIVVPTDSKATYFILERGGTADKPTLVTKRVGPSGTSYSKRQFDCKAHTFKYLGDGDSLEEMRRSKPDERMGELVEGSISDELWKEVCRKK